MFRTLLTPLRARFELSPRTAVPLPSLDAQPAPEDFARDVLLELMRNSVENLKTTTSESEKLQVLDEMYRVMMQDPCTKDVFCEMDGFVVLISLLTSLPSPEDAAKAQDTNNATRLCFQLISEGMYGHPDNTDYFKYNVGYGALANAIRTLISNPYTSDTTLGLLLGLALHDFSPSSIFVAIHGQDSPSSSLEALDLKIGQFTETLNTTIRRRGAFLTLWNFLCLFLRQDRVLRYSAFRIIEILSSYNHRNLSILSSLGLLGPLFDAWRNASVPQEANSDQERQKEKQLLSKLLKRLQDLGSMTSHARLMFQRALKYTTGETQSGDDRWTLDLEVLELIRYGMKSRWLDHFSMEPSALLVSHQEKVRGLPNTGITFLAWIWMEHLPSTSESMSSVRSSTSSSSNSPNPHTQTHALFAAQSSRGHALLRVSVDTNGKLHLFSSPSKHPPVILSKSSIKPKRWAHISIVWYPQGSKSAPQGGSLRVFIDGVLTDAISSLPYPKQEFSTQTITYTIGDAATRQQPRLRPRTSSSSFHQSRPSPHRQKSTSSLRSANHLSPASPPLSSTPSSAISSAGLSPFSSSGSNATANGWEADIEIPRLSYNLASSHLLSTPISDETVRFIHHLGPRYTGNFQDSNSYNPRTSTGSGSGGMSKMLTYEASTSLNMFLATVASSSPPDGSSIHNMKSSQAANLMKIIKTGPSIPRSAVVFSVFPADFTHRPASMPEEGSDNDVFTGAAGARVTGGGSVGLKFKMQGDVFLVRSATMDQVLWKIGGAVVAIKLVSCANTPHELSRSIGVLVDGMRNSWQNSDDMERLRGYEILADILHAKAKLVNITAFETLFEFLGISFANPENTTITNTLAYLSLVISFPAFLLWSLTSIPIQRLYWEHFSLLLTTSRFRRFNVSKNRLGKWNLVRRLLFVLNVGWFDGPPVEENGDGVTDEKQQGWVKVVDAIKLVAQSQFTKDEAIKPIVSHLAAHLHEAPPEPSTNPSPVSTISHILPPILPTSVGTSKLSRRKASYLLTVLTSLLSNPSNYTAFAAALPVTRVCILLLGDHPTSSIAAEVLKIILYSIRASRTFIRKFELVSGWNVVKVVLPGPIWDDDVNEAAMNVLLGRWSASGGTGEGQAEAGQVDNAVVCPSMAPIILTALGRGLNIVVKEILAMVANAKDSDAEPLPNGSADTSVESSEAGGTGTNTPTGKSPSLSVPSSALAATMERLLEQLINLHASSPSFRDIYRSQQTTQIFIDGCKSFVPKAGMAIGSNTPDEWVNWAVRILEKLSHLGLALALDTNVSGGQKREILDVLHNAESIINPTAEKTAIDPSLVGDSRSVRVRIASASARLSLQGVGERTIMKTVSRISDWRKTIQASEKNRFRKNVLDMRETRRQVSRLYDCLHVLAAERGLWQQGESAHLWRLDETEGPHRVRKKLERLESENASNSRVDSNEENIRSVSEPSNDTQGATPQAAEVPPWAENYEIAATEEDSQLVEDIADDKHRRVRHELEPGDVIEGVATVARISGVDSSPGLLIIGRTHIYMLDGVVENDDGEVIDAQDAPKSLFFVPGSIIELNGPQRAQRWPLEDVATFSDKTFLFRDVGIELYFKDSRSLLVVFLSKQKRARIDERLRSIIDRREANAAGTPGLLKTPLFRASARMWALAVGDELATAQSKWQSREISNFTYLSILNQISGRTPSDATQYPVFPWVLGDYTSTTLDLSSSDSYRDLSKPMGALTEARRDAASTRYTNLASVDELPFHYGTHFSSSMIVCHFLIRLAPFTNMFKTLQGGDWDLPDRLFSNIAKSFESAAVDVRGDVRELIPEFFTCPEFLENSANHDFGIQQNTGLKIHDVILPPWAKGDPLLFVEMNRRALESRYVSEHLHEWIDLIWGCKQRDPDSLNCFHPLSYEGAVDLDSMTNELEKEATVGIIHNFGQTPRKLFSVPHPSRIIVGEHHSLPIGAPLGIAEDSHLLVQDPRCFKDLGPTTPVFGFGFDAVGEKMMPCAKGTVIVPSHPYEQIEWDPERKAGSELRYLVDATIIQTVESAACTCASFADSSTLATGCSDYTVRLWKVARHGQHIPPELKLSHIMRTHTEEVTCVHACRAWSIVVSGSKDGSVAFWDLSRGIYVRSIWHSRDSIGSGEIGLVAVHESTGHVASCSRTELWLHTINGRAMAVLDLTTLPSYSYLFPTITSMAFLEREYSDVGVLATGSSDGTITLRTWNTDKTPEGEKAKWEWVDLRSMRVRGGLGPTTPTQGRTPTTPSARTPAVTALRFLGESLCHGEETGKSFMWHLPDD